MSTHSSFEESLGALMEDERRRLGDPPSSEELGAYYRNRVSADEAERIREHLAYDPSTLDRLLDLAALADSSGDPDSLSDSELGEDWQAIQARLRAKVVAFPSRVWQMLEHAVAIAALLAVMVLGLRLGTQSQRLDELTRRLTEPRVNEVHYEVLPDGARRGGATREPPIRISPGESGTHLTFALFDSRGLDDYRLDLHEANQTAVAEPLWSTDALVLHADDTFELGLAPGFLPPGEYVFRLYGAGEDEIQFLLASYSIQF